MTTNQSQYEEMIIPVRCKDCKWSIKENNGSLVCDNQFGATDDMGYVSEDGYCYHGERGTE